ncbi:MAG: hypothetical protein ACTSW1_00680 [Candidatus Hodarchaeales archaeon]
MTKGVANIVLFIILGVVGVLGLVGMFGIAGRTQNLLSLIFDNFFLIIGIIVSLGIAVSLVAYFIKNPTLTKDAMLMTGFSVVMVILLVLALPVFGGKLGYYEADLTYGVHYDLFGPVRITTSKIENFKKVGPFAIRVPRLGIIRENVKATITTKCGGKVVHQDSHGFTITRGMPSMSITRKIKNLPSGKSCVSTILLECSRCESPGNVQEVTFTVPRGE